MKKLLLIMPVLFLLTGCIETRSEIVGDDDSCFKVYCDEKYGVEYIQTTCRYQAGITVRLDENGDVIRCGENIEVNHESTN